MSKTPWLAISLIASLMACSTAPATPDSGPAAGDAGPSTRGRVTGTVTFAGNPAGKLTVGAWTSTPPIGPPTQSFSTATPTFPVTYEITNLRPGTYYVGAILDIAPVSPTIPGVEDAKVFPPEAITVVGGDTFTVDMTLVGP